MASPADTVTFTVTTVPGIPSNNIILTPNPPVIPANGDSSSTITSTEIRDSYGNLVSTGTLITVSTTLGSITTPDANPSIPGRQVATDSLGKITFTLQSDSTTGGEALVAAHSVDGDAYGTTTVRMEKLNLLTIFTRRSLVSRGEVDTVSMSVRNEGAGTAHLDTAGLSFTGKLSGDLTSEYTVTANSTNPDSIAPGATVTLSFWVQTDDSATVDDTVTISGFVNGTSNSVQVTDNTPQQADWWVVQRPAQLAVDSVWASTDTVSQGQTGLTVWMTVLNLGEANAQIEGDLSQTGPVFSSGNNQYGITLSSGPGVIAGGEKGRFVYNVTIGGTSSPGTIGIDGRATGRDANSGYTVSDSGANTADTWVVQTPANLSINTIYTSPTVVSQGQAGLTVTMSVNNLGQARALITSSGLNFTAGTVNRNGDYTVTPAGDNPNSILGGSQDTFSFTVDVSPTASPEYITIDGLIAGQDANSGATASDSSAGQTDGWTVQSSSDLVSTIAASPNQLSEGQNISVTMTVTNNGGATVDSVTPSILTLSGTGDAHLYSGPSPPNADLAHAQSVDFVWIYSTISGDHGTVRFTGNASGTDANSGNPVSSGSSSSNWVTIQTPAYLSIGSISCTYPSVSRGQQGIPVTMTVSNPGGAIAYISSAGLTFWQGTTNRTSDYIVTPGSNPDFIPGSSSRTFSYQVKVRNNAHLGTVTIKGTVTGTDANSGNQISDSSPSQPHNWVVQTPASLVLDKIETFPTTVNQGQSGITVSLIVDNNGQATALVDSVDLTFWQGATDVSPYYQVQLNNGPTEIPGSTEDTVYSFLVDVEGNAPQGLTTLDGKIFGRDANSNYPTSDIGANQTDSWEVEAPAGINLLSVRPSQSKVNQNQGVDWQVFLIISNSGDASVRLDSSKVRFYIGGEVTGEYTIQEPQTFEGSGSTIISGGKTDSLAFLVDSTGTTLGTATIRGFFWGEDLTSQAKIEEEIWGNHPFQVQTQANLNLSIWIDSPAGACDDTLSTQQSFQVMALVTNGGEAGVEDSGTIALNLPPGYSTEDTSINFTVGSPRIWEVTAPDSSRTPELLSAQISTSPLDANTHQPAFVNKGEDSIWVVTVRRAELSTNLEIIRLPGAPEDTVSTNQVFTLKSWMENLGEAGTYGQGYLNLSLPSGYTLYSGSNPVQIEVGDTAEFEVQSPETSQALDTIKVRLIQPPKDENTDADAWVNRWEEGIPITTVYAGSVAIIAQISSPVGASDGTLSTDQDFWVNATISATPNLIDTLGFLERYPVGYTLLSDSVQKPVDGKVTWRLRAPSVPVLLDSIILIEAQGIDQNSGIPVQSLDTILVKTIERADLKLFSFINSPEGARDGVVSTHQWFEVDGLVTNQGQAGVDSTGRLKIDLGNTGLTLLSDDTSQAFIPGDTVRWFLSAPDSAISLSELTMRMNAVPNDENTDSTALVSVLIDTIMIETVRRADLAVSTQITTPSGATDDTLSTDQQFVLTAWVENKGSAGVTGPGELSLITGEVGFWTEDSTRTFYLNGAPTCSVSWEISAPETPLPLSWLVARLTNPPLDVNSDQTAWVSEGRDSVGVVVLEKGVLTDTVEVSEPAGARDDTLSTDQYFTVRTKVFATSTVIGTSATINLPIGYLTDEPTKKDASLGEVTWRVKAPQDTSLAGRWLKVTTQGWDENSGQAVEGADSIEIYLLPRSDLRLSLSITDPPDARDGILSTGQEFTIEALVENMGRAGVYGSGRLSIDFGLTGCTTDSLNKPFQVHEPVTWRVKAPDNPTTRSHITVEIDTLPLDENSDQPSYSSVPQDSLGIETVGGASIVIEDLSPYPPIVSQGQEGVYLAVEVKDQGGAEAILDSLKLVLPEGAGIRDSLIGTLPDTIVGGGYPKTYQFGLKIGVSTPPGWVKIDAQAWGRDINSDLQLWAPGAQRPESLLVQIPASLEYLSLDPDTVSQGQMRKFSISLKNNGEAKVTLSPDSTKLEFTGFRAWLDSTTTIQGNGAITPIGFQSTEVDSLGYWDILLTLVGEENSAPFHQELSVPLALLVQTPASITLVGGQDTVVSSGKPGVFELWVSNSGEADVVLEKAKSKFIIFDQEGDTLVANLTTEPPIISGGGSPTFDHSRRKAVKLSSPRGVMTQTLLTFEGRAPDSLKSGNYKPIISLVGWENGYPDSFFFSSSSTPDLPQIRVERRAQLVYQGGLSPRQIYQGEKVGFSLEVANRGEAGVNLDTARTMIQMGGYSSYLKSTTHIPGGGSALLSFNQKLMGLDPSQYTDIRLILLGWENGMGFGDTISLTDTVWVKTEAKVSYLQGSVKPKVVSPGEEVSFSLKVKNSGSSFIQLDPDSSFIRFGGPQGFLSRLNPATSYLWGEGETEISFQPHSVPQDINPKAYPPQVRLYGLQNNESPWQKFFSVDEIRVEAPSLLVNSALDLDSISVGVGEEVDILGLEVINENGEEGHKVGITELRFGLDDGKNKPLHPTQFLTGAFLKRGSQVIGQGESQADQVRIALSPPFLLDPGYKDTLILSLNISPTGEGKSFRVVIDSAGIKASDMVEGVPIGQAYVGSAEGFPLRSKKLVVLKADLSSLVSYPNPFDPHSQFSHIVYYLPKDSDVALRIYTLTGELVRKLHRRAGEEGGKEGKNIIKWNGRNGRGIMVRNGVYICQVEAGGKKAMTKIAVVK